MLIATFAETFRLMVFQIAACVTVKCMWLLRDWRLLFEEEKNSMDAI